MKNWTNWKRSRNKTFLGQVEFEARKVTLKADNESLAYFLAPRR